MHKVIDLVIISVCSGEATDLVVVKEQVSHNGTNKSHHQKRHTEPKRHPQTPQNLAVFGVLVGLFAELQL